MCIHFGHFFDQAVIGADQSELTFVFLHINLTKTYTLCILIIITLMTTWQIRSMRVFFKEYFFYFTRFPSCCYCIHMAPHVLHLLVRPLTLWTLIISAFSLMCSVLSRELQSKSCLHIIHKPLQRPTPCVQNMALLPVVHTKPTRLWCWISQINHNRLTFSSQLFLKEASHQVWCNFTDQQT